MSCSCNPRQLEQYQSRLSGPILDRIDIQVTVPRVEYSELQATRPEESSATIRERVMRARKVQEARYQKQGVYCNAQASGKILQTHCQLEQATHVMLERSMERFGYSGRAHNRILKLARTIADLEGAENIAQHHVMEAVNLRSSDRVKQEKRSGHSNKRLPSKV